MSDDVFGDDLNTYLNRAAFAQPALGTFGNYERNSIRGRRTGRSTCRWRSRSRSARRRRVELRVEAFNLLNNFNWGTPGLVLSAGTFGRVTSNTGEMRILQFGIKYGF